MNRKLSLLIILLILSFCSVVPVFAASLGNLQYWYSNASYIYRWDKTPKVWYSKLDNNMTQLELDGYVNHARSQWNIAGVGSSYTSEKYSSHIRIQSGSFNTIREYVPALDPEDVGVTVFRGDEFYEGDYHYYGKPKKSYKMYGPILVFIVVNGSTPKEYRSTTTHELGHALGYRGHHPNTDAIMYKYSNGVEILKSTEKQHLNQIY